MTKHKKMGHRQAMYAAGMILRWIDDGNAISTSLRQSIRCLFESKTVEQFDKYKIEAFRKMLLSIVDEATTDYYEEVIPLKSLTQTIRITKAFYDVLNGLELMELE